MAYAPTAVVRNTLCFMQEKKGHETIRRRRRQAERPPQSNRVPICNPTLVWDILPLRIFSKNGIRPDRWKISKDSVGICSAVKGKEAQSFLWYLEFHSFLACLAIRNGMTSTIAQSGSWPMTNPTIRVDTMIGSSTRANDSVIDTQESYPQSTSFCSKSTSSN